MFVAVVPTVGVVEAIAEFLEPRREADPALRWTEPYQWHLTLAFLPQVRARDLDELIGRLTRSAARREPFEVTLTGSGAFPDAAQARVLWLGARSEPDDALRHLATGLRAAANKAGAVVQGGRFRAHLTFARVRRPQDATRWLRVLNSLPPITWRADHIELLESYLGQGRAGHPRYEMLAACPLGPAKTS